ncbi:methyltransferase type 11 [Niveomyces insectorum RCEF 264]|uniref:Methyltransferase type 11 n=1 Tax=Niveomyces insectorum RCEF 264 TaxID=1081102 RepID=A0A167Z8X5_9HYPO|nr:methyltransferase type 11 [Niveomyces insectorum RCEF 264]
MAEAIDETAPLVNNNPVLQAYYASLESRLGYRFLLGDRRHFGYYDTPNAFPLPVGRALRRMEDKLLQVLQLPAGSRLLDAGCGTGLVALHLARYGMRVTGIDVVDRHVQKARANMARAAAGPNNTDGEVTVRKMDYHHLGSLPAASYDGVYTMETFVHATDPEGVLAGFHRLLRPGGRIALFEYDNTLDEDNGVGDGDGDNRATPNDLAASMRQINVYSAMPTNTRSRPGQYEAWLVAAGFEDVEVHDLSPHIRPMLRLFWLLAMVPYFFITLLGLQKHFINTVAGYQAYRGQAYWRYVAVTATKPGGTKSTEVR